MLGCNLFLKKLNNLKFLNVINPVENREVVFSISISIVVKIYKFEFKKSMLLHFFIKIIKEKS